MESIITKTDLTKRQREGGKFVGVQSKRLEGGELPKGFGQLGDLIRAATQIGEVFERRY